MSQENVEIVKAAVEAWNAGDMDAFRELYDPNVILQTPEDWPEPGPYVGREAVMRQLVQNRETWDADSLEVISDFLEAGDRVAVRYVWRGAGHGPRADLELTMIATVRKGRTVYQEFFWDHAEALEILGLTIEIRQPEMPQDLEDLARFGYEWFNREKEPPPTWHPDGEFINTREDPDHTTYRGIDAIRKQHQGWLDSYPDLHLEPLEIRSNGEKVFIWVEFSGHSAHSGVPLRMELAHVGTYEDGKLLRLQEYSDRGEALKATGLSEQ